MPLKPVTTVPSPVDVSLLRALRRSAALFDETPSLRGLFIRAPSLLRMFGGNGAFFVPHKPLSASVQSVEDFAALQACAVANSSMDALLRTFFRSALSSRSPAMESQSFAIVKYLNAMHTLASGLPLDDNRPGPTLRSARPEWSEIRPGLVLVAHPLADDVWSRSVVLLTKHEILKGGTEGYILNKEASGLELQVRSLLRLISGRASRGRRGKTAGDLDVALGKFRGTLTAQKHVEKLILNQLQAKTKSEIFYGGPVPSAEILHNDEACAKSELGNSGMFFGMKEKISVDGIVEAASFGKPADVKKFLGCAAWTPGQLAHEINEGFWIPVAVDDAAELRKIVFHSTGDKTWKTLMASLGPDFAELARLPANASKVIDLEDEEDAEENWSEEEDWENEFDR